MPDPVFQNRERVAEGLDLPNTVRFSVIGPPSFEYQTELLRAVEEVVDPKAISYQSSKPSRKGKHVSYRFKIFMTDIDQVEAFYRRVKAVEGTRYII